MHSLKIIIFWNSNCKVFYQACLSMKTIKKTINKQILDEIN